MSETYYLFSSGKLSRKDNVIRLETINGEYKDLKIEVTRDIYVFGEVSLNTKCLNYLGQLKIPVHIFNYYGHYTGSFYPKESYISGKLLINQVEHYLDIEKRLKIAIEFLEGGVHNILRNLRYYCSRGKNLESEIEEIVIFRRRMKLAKSITELMGIEGNIRKVYYSCWNKIFNDEVEFEKRVKNPPDNFINSLISFLNTLIYTVVLTEIYKTQLNPTISYLHTAGERRFSLCLDIAEIFKPVIVDRLIFRLINRKIISEKDFDVESNFCYIKDKAKKNILRLFDESLKETIKHKILKRDVSYRHLIRLECYKLIKLLIENEEYNSFKMWW